MAMQPLDRAKAKHGMNTSRRQQPQLVNRRNRWVRRTIASIYGPDAARHNFAWTPQVDRRCGHPWCWGCKG